ncbi:hypothetical protein V8U11_20795 [Pseudomonas chlororaphis]|uniref:hypothetical protein n=1 Tax=Pseudomonas chlororaphis TaxID=587753 RepID=UPI0030D14687
MRIAIDADALITAFSGENFDLEDIIRPSILAITSNIIDDYTQKILFDGSGLGKEWLSRHLSNPEKIRYILDEELSHYDILDPKDKTLDYVGAAFLHGHQLITASKEPKLLAKAKDYGVRLRDSSCSISPQTLPGYSIIFNLLLNSSTTYKHIEIRHFFAKEKSIIIYDRYMKESSLCLLEQVLIASHELTNITVISDFDRDQKSTISQAIVQQRLSKIKPKAKINCYFPDLKKLDDKHDRHIHLGDRLQLSFSSGIDCFGLPPNFNNSECDIVVHYLSKDHPFRDYYVTTEPKGRRSFIIKARSKI